MRHRMTSRSLVGSREPTPSTHNAGSGLPKSGDTRIPVIVLLRLARLSAGTTLTIAHRGTPPTVIRERESTARASIGGCRVKKKRKRRAVRKMKVSPSEPSSRGRLSNSRRLLRSKAARHHRRGPHNRNHHYEADFPWKLPARKAPGELWRPPALAGGRGETLSSLAVQEQQAFSIR
jgi:hypothetical protein